MKRATRDETQRGRVSGRGSADRRWSWSQARESEASLVADDTLSDIEITSKAGVGKATLERWKKVPKFYARVHEIREGLRKTAAQVALQHGVANCRERMMCLNELWNRLQRVVNERAKLRHVHRRQPRGQDRRRRLRNDAASQRRVSELVDPASPPPPWDFGLT